MKPVRVMVLSGLVALAGVTAQSQGPTTAEKERLDRQASIDGRARMGVVHAAAFAVSPPLSSFAAPKPEPHKGSRFKGRDLDESRPEKRFRQPDRDTGDADAALEPQLYAPAPAIPSPSVSFEGLSSADNQAAFGFQVLPPDPNIDVGPNHVVQQTNLLVRIFNRTGTPLATTKLSTLFTSLGGDCATHDDGDPIVLYDPLSDRWLLSQFSIAGAAPGEQCIAVSTTGDPTGSYYLYAFAMPANTFQDYPKLGVWPDAYYMTTNQFNTAGTAFIGAGVFAFDRLRMIAGDPAASYVYFDLFGLDPNLGGMLPVDFDGVTLPPASTPGLFAAFTANEFGDPADALRLFDFHADFVTPANSTFTERADSPLAVAAFDPRNPSGRSDIAQPTTAVGLDAIGDRLLHRLQYRNRGGTHTLAVTHTVNVSGVSPTSQATYRAAVRWYQLHRTGATWSVAQQGSYSPDTDGRWMGSAATDNQGNLAVGYSVSSGSTFPSLRWAGRLLGDAAGTLAQGEATVIAGAGAQTSGTNRWGDYSAMIVDPVDDCTFWFNSEYMAATSTAGWQTRVGAFKFASCTAPAKGTIAGEVRDGDTNALIGNAVVEVNGLVAVTDGSGQFVLPAVAPGSYQVSARREGYASSSANASVTDGMTTNVTVYLTGVVIAVAGAKTILAESCVSSNGAPDPGEVVDVELCVSNVGAKAAVNLMGGVQLSGGVTAATSAASYGAMISGATVCRVHTLRMGGRVGDPVLVTLALSDAANSYASTAQYGFVLGAPQVLVNQAFDGVTPPALPAGWTSTVDAAGTGWTTSAAAPDTAPNHATASGPGSIGASNLLSATLPAGSIRPFVSFRHSHNFEANFDGGVLELQIGGGAFTDVLAAGGVFSAGPYTSTLSGSFGNPLGGRAAWSGNSSGYKTTTLSFPNMISAPGTLRFAWRFGSDSSVVSPGPWRVDSIMMGAYASCQVPSAFGDLTGDAVADRAVYRRSNGGWYVNGGATTFYGLPSDIPVLGDYDGDRRFDVALFRPTSGAWLIPGKSPVIHGQAGDVPVPADYDGDGLTDLAVWRPSNGTWYVLGKAPVVHGQAGDAPVQGDYDGDGKAEMAVFRRSTGTWFVLGQAAVPFGQAGDIPVPGDYDDDGDVDIAVYRPTTGTWYLRNIATVNYGAVGDVPVPMDMTGDGRAELVVWRPQTGAWFWYNLVGGASSSQVFGQAGDTPAALPPFRAMGVYGDADGDRRADPGFFRPSTGGWFHLRSASSFANFLTRTWGLSTDVIVPGDYDGDRLIDAAVWRPSTGVWYLNRSSGAASLSLQFGASTDRPVPADFDGDGITDIAVWRPSTGVWYTRTSSSNYASGAVVQWGVSTDIPVPADFDGDGRADLGLYRPSTGVWYVRTSSSNYASGPVVPFGVSTDLPVAADYDGDGKADVAVWRPSTGVWYVVRSSTGATVTLGSWGASSDLPVPADWNGDGLADAAVLRPASFTWFVQNQFTVQWGATGDRGVLVKP